MHALFLGKFQPPHIGHLVTIRRLAEKYINLTVGITEGEPRAVVPGQVAEIFSSLVDEKNVDYRLIKGVFEEGTQEINLSEYDVICSGNEKVLDHCKNLGASVEYVPRSIDNIYNGTSIRDTVKESAVTAQAKEIYEFKIVDIDLLKPIELIYEHHFRTLERKIIRDEEILVPLIVCSQSGAVLDGSHRYAFLIKHGYKTAPAMVVDYWNESIFVGNEISHRLKYDLGKTLTKEKVIDIAYSGNLLQPRTTRHFFPFEKNEWPCKLSELGKGEERDISNLLSVSSLDEQIVSNERYLAEIYEEYDALISYMKEQSNVRKYLLSQIESMRKERQSK